MKYSLSLLFVVGILVTGLHAFPGLKRDREDNDKSDGMDTVLILEDSNPFDELFHDSFSLKSHDRDDESEDTPQGSWKFFPFRRPQVNYDDLFASMMAQLNHLLSNIPPVNRFSPGIDIPPGSNSTSETKVVDGHVVTVNETTYNHVNDTHTAIFRFKIVDVKPQNETVISDGVNSEVEEVTILSETSTPESSIEEKSSTEAQSVEDFSDNEIPKTQVKML